MQLKKAIEFRVFGKVQGVFFRGWAKEQATRLGLSGWAKNLEDGSLLIHIEGDSKAIEAFENLKPFGPPASKVSKLIKQNVDFLGLKGFDIF